MCGVSACKLTLVNPYKLLGLFPCVTNKASLVTKGKIAFFCGRADEGLLRLVVGSAFDKSTGLKVCDRYSQRVSVSTFIVNSDACTIVIENSVGTLVRRLCNSLNTRKGLDGSIGLRDASITTVLNGKWSNNKIPNSAVIVEL